MLAAKHFDPVVGVDIHIIQPPGPVPPVPIPHPFVGFVMDPADYAPIIGSTVQINGMHRAQAGTAVVCTPPHIPIGGVFVPPPPGNEGEIFMGSATVEIDGEAQSYMSLPVLSCQSVGMPSLPRMTPKKKTIPKSLMLPTSMVLPIPAGPPVMIGGPPTISIMGMAMKAGFAALGKGFKKLRKLQKASKKVKAFSDKVHAAAKKAMKKLGIPPNVQNKVHRKICSVTGHPVDIATGKVFTDAVDIELPGPLPLRWERVYFSTSVYDGPLGYGWHHTYDMALAEEEDAVVVRLSDGRSATFPVLRSDESWFDRQERMTLRRDRDGYVLSDSEGLLWRFARVTFDNDQQALQSVSDRAGNCIEFSYDKYGRLELILDSAGRRLPVITDDSGKITEIRGPHPEKAGQTIPLVSYEYDGKSRLTAVSDALSQAMTFRYKGGLLIQETDRNGLSFYFEYDGSDQHARCVHTWGDGGIYDHHLQFDLALKQTRVTNSLGHSTLHFWNDDGLVIRTVDPLECVRETIFNEFHQPVAEIDELGQTTTYEYDDRGNRTVIVTPDEARLEFVYNELDMPVRAIDANGKFWFWNYDEHGQLISRKDPTGREVRFEYSAGCLTAIFDPAGNARGLSYTGSGQLETVTEPNNNQTTMTYDRLGRTVAVKDSRGHIQTREYDAKGRVTRVVEPDGNFRSLRYDAMGNVVFYKDLQREMHFSYQGMGRLASRREAGMTLAFSYNTEEDLIGITNEHGDVVRFELDERRNIAGEFGFDGIRRIYTRDNAGRVIRLERASGLITLYTYDLVGRLLAVQHSDGAEEAFVYRKDGHLLSGRNENIVVRFERDEVGRILKEYQGDFWVSSEYGPGGQRTSIRSSLGALQTIVRDAMGNVTGMQYRDGSADPSKTLWETVIQRDQMGLELERSLPGGIVSRWERDKLGQPLRHQVTGQGASTRSVQYQWGPGDRLKGIVDAHHGTTLFEHDEVGNLISAAYQDGTVEFRMPDAVGNLFRTRDRSDRKYGPAGQLLEATGSKGVVRYKYDSEGNLIRKITPEGNWEYRWNSSGTLRSVLRPDGQLVSFQYDVFGRRTCKSCSGRSTRFFWDANSPLHELFENDTDQAADLIEAAYSSENSELTELSMRDSVIAEHRASGQNASKTSVDSAGSFRTWLMEGDGFAPVAAILNDGQAFSVVCDIVGAPTVIHDTQGALKWSGELSVYGALRSCSGSEEFCPFRWAGQYYDAETGLCYNRFRYFDSDTGEYVSQDPALDISGLILARYVSDSEFVNGSLWALAAGASSLYRYPGDPLIWTDPFGLVRIHTEKGVEINAYPGPEAGGIEHKPLHAHVREGNTETRVLMEDYHKKGKLVASKGDVYPGDPDLSKKARKIVKSNLDDLADKTDKVFRTGGC